MNCTSQMYYTGSPCVTLPYLCCQCGRDTGYIPCPHNENNVIGTGGHSYVGYDCFKRIIGTCGNFSLCEWWHKILMGNTKSIIFPRRINRKHDDIIRHSERIDKIIEELMRT